MFLFASITQRSLINMTLAFPSSEKRRKSGSFYTMESNRCSSNFPSHIVFYSAFYQYNNSTVEVKKQKPLKPSQCTVEWEFFNEADFGLIQDLATLYLSKLGHIVGVITVSTTDGCWEMGRHGACSVCCCACHWVNSYYVLVPTVISGPFPLCRWLWPTKI